MSHSDVQSEFSAVRLPLNLDSLKKFLAAEAPDIACTDLVAKEFGTGTSNPTYLLWSAANESKRFVLRRKPPGVLLRGAHQIDREYMVMKALHAHGVPVPKMFAYCKDTDVIGQEFFVMECIAGRVLQDAGSTTFSSASDRAQLWKSIAKAAALMHSVDYKAVGLESFGKAGDYAARQVKTWGRNFDAADPVVQKALQRPELTTSMHKLRDHLLAGMSVLEPEPTCVVHGDFNVHNMLMHPTEPRVAAILDWEISTVGHPLIDVDYACSGLKGGWMPSGATLAIPVPDAEGLPTRQEFIAEYFQQRGLPMPSNDMLEFASLVNCFRFAAIIHGVLARGLSGNAASGTSKNELMGSSYVKVVAEAMARLQKVKGGAGQQSKL